MKAILIILVAFTFTACTPFVKRDAVPNNVDRITIIQYSEDSWPHSDNWLGASTGPFTYSSEERCIVYVRQHTSWHTLNHEFKHCEFGQFHD